MKQPDLGKKIAELRKAKGLTQEELVEKCNLSVRTLQRIESGEVTPRSYTIKIIFAALDYAIYDSLQSAPGKSNKPVFIKWFEHLYENLITWFNLKTNRMKKISILSVILIVLVISLFAAIIERNSKNAEKAINAIVYKQNKWNEWLNKGEVDSVLNCIYRDDACVLPNTSGKIEIRELINSALEGGYKLKEFQNISISVCDSIAVQKSFSVYEYSGSTFKQKSLTEWRLTHGQWFVVNDIMQKLLVTKLPGFADL